MGHSHFDDAVIRTDVEHFAPELVRQTGDSIQMLMLMPQRLTSRHPTRVIVLPRGIHASFRRLTRSLQARRIGLGDLPMMRKHLLEILRSQHRDLGQQQLPLHERCTGIIQDRPYGDQVLELPPRLFDDAVLAGEHDCHAGEVFDFGVADDEGVDVEAAGGEDTGDAREDTRFVLHQAVEDVAFWGQGGWDGGFVEDGGDGGGGGP